MQISLNEDSLNETLQGWKGESIEQVLWLCRETLEDISWPTVKVWRENGGKVLGH
ncbi:MAG TPA: hypothetical protein HA303_01465, partial [Candidatus Thalassarchaeaceae archaeon]|nr:hypothetical protein [Candidatus Thalassarchaeaceae archaeon]